MFLRKMQRSLKKKSKKEIANVNANTNVAQLNKLVFNLSETITHGQISYWRKEKFRGELDTLKKQLLDVEKINKANQLATALEECKQMLADSSLKEKKFLIKEFKVGGEAKSLNEILKTLRQSLADASIMLFSIDELNGKVLCLSSVPDVRQLI